MTFTVLSAGAAKAVISQVGAGYSNRAGLEIAYYFSAVGEIRDLVVAGQPSDVVVVTDQLIDELSRVGTSCRAPSPRSVQYLRVSVSGKVIPSLT